MATGQVAALTAPLLAVVQLRPPKPPTRRCVPPQTSVFAAENGGRLWRYPLNAPGSASSTWSAHSQVGNGWHAYARVIGGPGGQGHGINASGLYRYRWTSSGWEQTNGSSAQRISTDFTQYATASFRNKITIDERGDFYAVDAEGRLRTYRYDEAAGGWTFSGRLLDTGWGRFNLVVAAGQGVLYTRDATDGRLFRYRYDADSQRWIDYQRQVGGDWNIFGKGVFSAGGDTLFGIEPTGPWRSTAFVRTTAPGRSRGGPSAPPAGRTSATWPPPRTPAR
jgi:hypothetical protein